MVRLRHAAHLSHWLADQQLAVRDLDDERVRAFVKHRRRRGYRDVSSPRSLVAILTYLRSVGAIRPEKPVPPATPLARLVAEYRTYLSEQRSLLPSTIATYAGLAERFTAARFRAGSLRWDRLSATDLHRFIVQTRSKTMSSRRLEVTALRSWLRFLFATKRLHRDLASGVPAVAGWRLAWLPKPLTSEQVERLLALHDPTTPSGQRAAAIVRLLLRLGLRVGDVAGLQLDDIDWRAGEITVSGKTAQVTRLPLPPDVGRALALYLRQGRPKVEARHVFIREHAPHIGLCRAGVLGTVIKALRRVGVATGGAHVLRQTAATQMLRHGSSLAEVAHVLRHRSVDTTAIYTKVDRDALRTLCRRWPGGAA
jgi:site-specific recombinase XerD